MKELTGKEDNVTLTNFSNWPRTNTSNNVEPASIFNQIDDFVKPALPTGNSSSSLHNPKSFHLIKNLVFAHLFTNYKRKQQLFSWLSQLSLP